jgi:hypothetical protein
LKLLLSGVSSTVKHIDSRPDCKNYFGAADRRNAVNSLGGHNGSSRTQIGLGTLSSVEHVGTHSARRYIIAASRLRSAASESTFILQHGGNP